MNGGSKVKRSSWLNVLIVILSAGMLVVSGLYVNLFHQLSEYRIELGRQREELDVLSAKYDRLAGLPELVNISIEKPQTHFSTGVHVVSGYSLDYWFNWVDSNLDVRFNFAIPFYCPQDNVTLRLYLYINPPNEISLPLTLQKGNAFLNESGVPVGERKDLGVEQTDILISPGVWQHHQYNISGYWQSPVIWSMNASESRTFDVLLPWKGWYTLSIIGPVKTDSRGMTELMFIWGRYENRTWHRVEYIRAWVDFKLFKDEKPVIFAIGEQNG